MRASAARWTAVRSLPLASSEFGQYAFGRHTAGARRAARFRPGGGADVGQQVAGRVGVGLRSFLKTMGADAGRVVNQRLSLPAEDHDPFDVSEPAQVIVAGDDAAGQAVLSLAADHRLVFAQPVFGETSGFCGIGAFGGFGLRDRGHARDRVGVFGAGGKAASGP